MIFFTNPELRGGRRCELILSGLVHNHVEDAERVFDLIVKAIDPRLLVGIIGGQAPEEVDLLLGLGDAHGIAVPKLLIPDNGVIRGPVLRLLNSRKRLGDCCQDFIGLSYPAVGKDEPLRVLI